MFKKLLLFSLTIFFLFPRQVFGFSFTIDSINPTSVSSKSDEVTVTLSITDLPNESYFRVAWQKGSEPYFGYMKDNNGNWVKIGSLSSDCTVYYKVTDTTTTSLTLTTKIGEDIDIDNGLYNIKAHRFTTGCTETPGIDAFGVEVNLPTPAPTESPTPSPSPSPTPTSTPKPTATAVATKRPTSTPQQIVDDEFADEDILGLREGLKNDESEEEEKTKKKFPLIAGIFIFGGVGLIGFASYSFIKNKKKEYNKKGGKGGFRKIEFKRDNL